MNDVETHWRVIDGVATAWFETPSLSAGAALAVRILPLSDESAIDLRASGVRVRLDTDEHTVAVSAAADDLGLTPNPSVLQLVSVVLDATNPTAARQFWQQALDYSVNEDGLTDPLRRDPALWIRQSTEPRPLRNRVHLDVVRPSTAVERVDLGVASGPYGVRHVDADGNEVDLVPGDALGETDATADWQAVFGAVACYRVTAPAHQGDLAAAVAALADDAGFPLRIDLRPGLVIIDSGKDKFQADAHGLDIDFTDLAASVQTAARDRGAVAEAGLSRFVQLFLDAADVAELRAFWLAALGYTEDRRPGVSDIEDPRGLNPVLVFQGLDATDTERRRQRNRIHIELAVPADVAGERLTTIFAAGGRLLDDAADHWRIADPEGNELVIVSVA